MTGCRGMRLCELRVSDCRNIEAARLVPDAGLTVIAGANGQGKTALLESIFLLTGSKSFRGARDFDLVRRGMPFGRVEGVAEADGRENAIEVRIEGPEAPRRGRFAKVNGVDYGRAAEIAGIFTAVVFEPGHLELVKGGPEGRRRFMDAALCQLYPGYIGIYRRYQRALTQKNALLKRHGEARDADAMLDAFDAQLAESGQELTRRRAAYLGAAGPAAENTYAELSRGAEKLEISFLPSAGPGALAQLLAQRRPTDLRAGFCTTGPHREDFEVLLDGVSARSYGSQGQQRSAALSLKLAEAHAAKAVTGRRPVLLLDDVLSELDEARQDYLLGHMAGGQSIVTTCDATAFARTAGKVLRVAGGKLEE